MTEHVFVIAEAGSNWRLGDAARDRAMARALIDAAAAAGADAVKFQTYRSRDLYAPDAGESGYLRESGTAGSINDVLAELEMPYEMIGELAAYAADQRIEFMSTPFSLADAEAVDPYVERHKIASYEINHAPLVRWLAGRGKPLLISTGAAGHVEIEFALTTARNAGARDITLLQCTARYPAPVAALNLAAIPTLRERYGVPVGLSDHSRDPLIGPVGAVALGASVVEKHFTLSNSLPGPDHPFALEPPELAAMIRAIRGAEQARGDGRKRVLDAEEELRRFAVRAIQATRDIEAGEVLRAGDNIELLRPGGRARGLDARHLDAVVGRRARRHIPRGDGVTHDAVEPPIT